MFFKFLNFALYIQNNQYSYLINSFTARLNLKSFKKIIWQIKDNEYANPTKYEHLHNSIDARIGPVSNFYVHQSIIFLVSSRFWSLSVGWGYIHSLLLCAQDAAGSSRFDQNQARIKYFFIK